MRGSIGVVWWGVVGQSELLRAPHRTTGVGRVCGGCRVAIITPAGVLEEESLSEYWKPFRTIIEDATQGRGLLGRVVASFGLDILFSVYRGGQSKGTKTAIS